ncbi:MAG: phage tail assembly protein [Oxalobacter sp.]|nr:phage tail assembly protein [Oxalobacter sp.]
MSKEFTLRFLLARLIKQPREFFSAMPAKDYAKLHQEVSNFLLV